MAKITLAEALGRPAVADRTVIDATSEADIRRHKAEDGFSSDLPAPGHGRLVRPPREVRRRLGMIQARFAALIGVPVASYRNWEQFRTPLPPSVRVLLDILDREPEAALPRSVSAHPRRPDGAGPG